MSGDGPVCHYIFLETCRDSAITFFSVVRLHAPTLATLLETTGPQFSLLIDMAFPEATYRVRVRVGLGQLQP